jgi:hypothetical protein
MKRPRIGDAVLVPALARAGTVWSYTSELLNYDVIGPFQSSVPVPANLQLFSDRLGG